MKTLLLMAAPALALGACQSPPALSAKLDCPQSEGALTLVSAAANGQSCLYHERDGAEVTLTRMPVKGSAMATLTSLEAELKALGGISATAAVDGEKGDIAVALSDAEAAKAKADAARVEAEARIDSKIDSEIDRAVNENTTVRGPHFQATVQDDGDGDERTQVDLPGLHIKAEGEKADVHVGPIHIDADGDNTATIKIYRDVRLRGEALSREKRGLRATFIYAGDDLSGGYKYLGYEASGPKAGPITVAVVKSKADNGHSDMYDDVKKLVRRNGGT